MREFFHAILYKPLYNLLIALVAFMPGNDLGLAIIAITIIIRLILHPFSISSFRSQRAIQKLQPQLRELKEKYKGDQQGFGQASMQLYKDNKVNPAASCLPLLLQLPILLSLYWVLRDGMNGVDSSILYSFIPRPEHVSAIAFGFLDLHKSSWLLAILAGAAQFVQAKMLQTPPPPVSTEGSKDEAMMVMMNKQMLYLMPALTVFIGWTLPAGLTIYWFLATVLTIVQQWFIFRQLDRDEAAKKA